MGVSVLKNNHATGIRNLLIPHFAAVLQVSQLNYVLAKEASESQCQLYIRLSFKQMYGLQSIHLLDKVEWEKLRWIQTHCLLLYEPQYSEGVRGECIWKARSFILGS